MDRLKERMAHIGLYVAALLKWMAVGALVGGVGGFVGAAFHLGVSYARGTAGPPLDIVPAARGRRGHRRAV